MPRSLKRLPIISHCSPKFLNRPSEAHIIGEVKAAHDTHLSQPPSVSCRRDDCGIRLSAVGDKYETAEHPAHHVGPAAMGDNRRTLRMQDAESGSAGKGGT